MKASSDTDIGSPVKKGWKVAVQHGTHMSSLYAHFEDLRVDVGQLFILGPCLVWLGVADEQPDRICILRFG